MSINISSQLIQNAFIRASNAVVYAAHVVSSKVRSANVSQYVEKALDVTAYKVRAIWLQASPIVTATASFFATKLGIASVCLFAAAACASYGRSHEDETIARAYLLSGFCLAVVSGIALSQAGIISSSFIQIFPNT